MPWQKVTSQNYIIGVTLERDHCWLDNWFRGLRCARGRTLV